MPQPNFRVVDAERPHARDLARVAVTRFRSNAERESLPVCNQHTDKEAKQLLVDDVIASTERVMQEEAKEVYQPNYFLLRLLILGLVLGLIWLVVEII